MEDCIFRELVSGVLYIPLKKKT